VDTFQKNSQGVLEVVLNGVLLSAKGHGKTKSVHECSTERDEVISK